MISKEAELFEKANIVDIGLQPGEFLPRRNSFGENSADNNIVIIDGLEKLDIDDNNLVVDEAFQRSLDERANQFMLNQSNNINTNSFPPIPKPELDYHYTDVFTLLEELDQWFTDLEIKKLQKYQQVYDSKFNVNFYNSSFDEQEDIINELISFNITLKDQLVAIVSIVSILSGHYGQEFESDQILKHITKNSITFIKLNKISWIAENLIKNFEICLNNDKNVEIPSQILFHCCTVLYLITLVGLNLDDDSMVNNLKNQFDKSNILITLVKFIDRWRWNNRNSMRIRNIIILFTKIFKFQIGDLKKRDLAKVYLKKRLNIISDDDDPNKLTASPIDFHTYRQELTTRYPSFIPPPSTLPKNFEDTSSLTQFISIPKNQPPRQMNASNQNPPNIHIATPIPSPSTSPNLMENKNIKGKRLIQSNFVYPLIYPIGNDEEIVPKSIQEATELFVSRVRDKIHLIQLWDEFDHFVKQERGWVDSLNENEEKFNYLNDYDDEFKEQIQSLNRIDVFYDQSLPYLSSLVQVLLELINSSQLDSNFFKTNEINEKTKDSFNIIKMKNSVLKDSSYLLILMLKWFRVNHILKFEHLSCLIYDSNYYSILINYLKSFDNEIFERIKDTKLRNFNKIDDYFCFTLNNLLTITSKITTQKTQRILDLSEKDITNVLKQIFIFINKPLWKPTLKLIKEIAPLKRKQWKAKNMDLISLVYLHGETSLRDNWLSGRDVDAEVNDRYGQEIALRALTQFYNVRKYNESMEKMGYKKHEHRFFTRENDFSNNEA